MIQFQEVIWETRLATILPLPIENWGPIQSEDIFTISNILHSSWFSVHIVLYVVCVCAIDVFKKKKKKKRKEENSWSVNYRFFALMIVHLSILLFFFFFFCDFLFILS